jgi:hypothetical protein
MIPLDTALPNSSRKFILLYFVSGATLLLQILSLREGSQEEVTIVLR